MYDLSSEYQITPLFNYIKEKSKEAGLYPYYATRKQTIELFIDHELLEDRIYPNWEKYNTKVVIQQKLSQI